MGKSKKTRKVAVKRAISLSDGRLKANILSNIAKQKEGAKEVIEQEVQKSTSMFFAHNNALGPPYHIILDTNFINISISNRLDAVKSSMDCLYAKCIPCVTECVIGELEKLGQKYRLALRFAKDKRFQLLKCDHKGTYADDCIYNRVKTSPIYIVATCDKDLRNRIRKLPGVPIMTVGKRKYSIERLPEDYGSVKC